MSPSLREILSSRTVADLKDLLIHLPLVPNSGRKDDLVARIAESMLGPAAKAIWSGLDEMQQAAVSEAVHHPAGEYSARRFEATYGSLPAFRIGGKKVSAYDRGGPSALCLFIHYSDGVRGYLVPADLREHLKNFVPLPKTLSLRSAESLPEEDGLIVRLTEREALQEVMVMLRTIEQEKIQVSDKTALPGAATLRILDEKLVGGDFYPVIEKKDKWDQQIGPIKAFAWPLLLQVGGLAQRSGTRLALVPAGVKALSAQPADILRGLWRKWSKTTAFDEFSRVDEIKGQGGKGRVMTAVSPRRAVIAEALGEVPVGRWVEFDDFSRFMRATDRLFEVAHDLWRLYIVDREYGSLGYEGSGGWNVLQERYMATLLFEYAATLGIVDLAYVDPARARNDFRGMWGADELAFLSRYDGLRHFRLTPLGAYVLGLADSYQPAAIEGNVGLSVLPSLQVNVVRGSLAAEQSLLLDTWAEPLQPGSWRLDRAKAIAAIEKGHPIAELKSFLEGSDDMPLPPPVESFIAQCERNGKALKTGAAAVLIECRDQEIADAIAAHKETASLCMRAAPKTLVVRSEHLKKFRERLSVLGYGMAA